MPDTTRFRFILNGNGPVSNRGCQAILFGTCKILDQEFGARKYLLASFAQDAPDELPPNIEPLELSFARPRWSGPWWKYQMRKRLGLPDQRKEVVDTLRPHLAGCKAMLSIGGDNYAIDYGYEIIERLVGMNKCAQSMGIPVIIWGASIGPFNRDPLYEKHIADHLSLIDLIVVREPITLKYLNSLGIEKNIVLAPDPSFVVDPLRPTLPNEVEKLIEGPFIGLNLSPMLAKYVSGNDLKRWSNEVTNIVEGLLSELDDTIILIPHVTSAADDPYMDDALFLESIRERLKPSFQGRVAVAPHRLSCEQLKWVISCAEVFVGARTHSTLAALSTGVPCISIAYSPKAWGINEWLFGNSKWVVPAAEVTAKRLITKVGELRQEKERMHLQLTERALRMRQEAFDAARYVRRVMENGNPV